MRTYKILFLLLLLSASTATAVNSWTKTETSSMQIELSSDDGDDMKRIDLSQYDLPQPEECMSPTVRCTEKTNVYLTVETEWTIEEFADVQSRELTAYEYAVNYPPIEVQEVLPASDPKDILLLQRALYDRGLLSVPPTGRFGALTERAILHFQQIKGYEEWFNGKVIAGERTIDDINAMKLRMQDPEYLQATTAPPLLPAALSPAQSERLDIIDTFIDAATRNEIQQVVPPLRHVQVDIEGHTGAGPDSTLHLEGYVQIKR